MLVHIAAFLDQALDDKITVLVVCQVHAVSKRSVENLGMLEEASFRAVVVLHEPLEDAASELVSQHLQRLFRAL